MAGSSLTKSLTHRLRKVQTNVKEVDTSTPKETKLDAPGFASRLIDLIPEMQILILCQMSLGDLLRFRLVCRGFNRLVNWNQSSIVIHFLRHGPLSRFARLYQNLATPSVLGFDILFNLSHRWHVVNHIAIFLARFHLIQVHHLTPPSLVEQPEYAVVVDNMARNMRPYLLMLYHFIEMYRAELAESVSTYQDVADIPSDDISTRVEARLIRQYNGHVIPRLCSMSNFLIKVIVRRLRPASYAGGFERLLRGWSRDPASEAQCIELLVIGSLETVNKTVTLSGFPARIAAIERHLQEFSSMKKPDHRPSRRVPVISRKGKSRNLHPTTSNAIMPPLDLETVKKISWILPGRDDFLDIKRLAPLFDPGVVMVDQVQTPWNFALAMMRDDREEPLDLVAGTSPPPPGLLDSVHDDIDAAENDEHDEGDAFHPYTWPSFSISTPGQDESSEYGMSSDDGR
ncbi:hypothetical protein MMC07_003821 [Pseudocyphellaria aurata]|nr:hypothetical protein [Pseudocyphellaria aurata]